MKPGLLILFMALAGAGLSGCSDQESDHPSLTSPDKISDSAAPSPRFALGGARLALSTSDPNQVYVGPARDPWLRYSLVTYRPDFTLRVRNTGLDTMEQPVLMVAVPSDLPPYGWSITLGQPGVVYSSLADFPETDLAVCGYPLVPHGVYPPEGNARFALIQGPSMLLPGGVWEIPVFAWRGAVPGFRIHFDAVCGPAWSPPHQDVTAIPPVQEELAPPQSRGIAAR